MLLRAGDLARGFEAHRWRFRAKQSPMPAIPFPDWEGEPIAGKRLAIFHEQGCGGTLQFVRYVPMAVARGARVTLFAPPALLELLRASLPGVEVTELLPDGDAAFDFKVAMLCLPRLFGTTLDTVPAEPYLLADPAAAAAWSRRLAALPGLKVGLVWTGAGRSYNAHRSLTLAQFAPLAAVPGIQFVSLQVGLAAEAKKPPAGFSLIDWSDEIRNFADTAALVAGLDLVITVDTSVAHLAGGLGRPERQSLVSDRAAVSPVCGAGVGARRRRGRRGAADVCVTGQHSGRRQPRRLTSGFLIGKRGRYCARPAGNPAHRLAASAATTSISTSSP